MAKLNSRRKGARGERDFAKVLQAKQIEARRGQQFAGGGDSPDVVTNLTNVHFEVKYTKAGNLYDWRRQAERDGKGKLAIVAHRRNRQPWVAIVDMHDLLDLLILREGTLL